MVDFWLWIWCMLKVCRTRLNFFVVVRTILLFCMVFTTYKYLCFLVWLRVFLFLFRINPYTHNKSIFNFSLSRLDLWVVTQKLLPFILEYAQILCDIVCVYLLNLIRTSPSHLMQDTFVLCRLFQMIDFQEVDFPSLFPMVDFPKADRLGASWSYEETTTWDKLVEKKSKGINQWFTDKLDNMTPNDLIFTKIF